MRGRVHQVHGASMKIEEGCVGFHFGHEFGVVLAFGKVRPRAVSVDVGAIAGPFCLDGSHCRRGVRLAWRLQIIHGLQKEIEDIVLFRGRECDFGYPHLPFDAWVLQGRLLLLGDWTGLGRIEQGSQRLDDDFGLEIPYGGGVRDAEGMPESDFEHERDFGKQ